jgi:hypothetical protein
MTCHSTSYPEAGPSNWKAVQLLQYAIRHPTRTERFKSLAPQLVPPPSLGHVLLAVTLSRASENVVKGRVLFFKTLVLEVFSGGYLQESFALVRSSTFVILKFLMTRPSLAALQEATTYCPTFQRSGVKQPYCTFPLSGFEYVLM